ncbi:MAG: hypothetical protein GX902_08425 [Lentisphaerae bacterium]|nr:hypothetical protein [Lentisphaerota bacterium]
MLCSPFPESIHTIGIFAPAKYPPPELYQLGREKLLSCGVACKGDLPTKPWRLFAGSDDERLLALQQLLQDPEVDLLLAACGGSGSARLLPRLDWQLWRERNLPVVGYSDITALHLAALRHGCRRQVHGPMLCRQWGDNAEAYAANMESLAAVLQGNEQLLPAWHGARVLQSGKATGQLIPANLTLLGTLLATPFLPDLKGAILVLEDVNLPAHALDRALNQLQQSGILGSLSGLIFGQFSAAEDAQHIPDILSEYATEVNGPVLCDLQFGHINPSLSLPVGRLSHLQVSSTGEISLRLDSREKYRPEMFCRDGELMPYRLLTPENLQPGRQYPLVLLLHGAGERGSDNLKQLIHLAEVFTRPELRRQHPCFVLVPQCPEDAKWVDSPWHVHSHLQNTKPARPLQLALELLETIQRQNPIDRNRVYILGLSMGGFGTWDAVCRYPERFAAAVPICGGGDPRQAMRLRDLPVWAFHGADDYVVPAELSRQMVQALQQCGGQVRYTEFPDCGHNSWDGALAHPQLLPWLFQQKKGCPHLSSPSSGSSPIPMQ